MSAFTSAFSENAPLLTNENPLKDLSLRYFGRTGLDLLEVNSGLNLNAKLLPSTSYFNGSDNYLRNTDGASMVGGEAISLHYKFRWDTNTINGILFCCGGTGSLVKGFYVYINKTTKVITCQSSSGSAYKIATFQTITAGVEYDLLITWNGVSDGTITSVLNGNTATSVLTIAWSGNSAYKITIGGYYDGATAGLFFKGSIRSAIIESTSVNRQYNLLGKSASEFDINFAGYLNWYGTGTHQEYSISASTALLDYGFSLWQSSENTLLYVINKADGTANDISTTFTNFVKLWSTAAGAIGNLPALIDFDYTAGANALLAVFDKSNATIHTNTSGMLYLDAAHPCRWTVSELCDPRIYLAYFNTGYKKMFSKVNVILPGSNSVNYLSEILTYSVDINSTQQYAVFGYCGIKRFCDTDSGHTFDANNYLVLNSLASKFDTIRFFGDSITAGSAGPTTQARAYADFTCLVNGLTDVNSSVGGYKLQVEGKLLYNSDNLPLNDNCIVYQMWGANDQAYEQSGHVGYDATNFKNEYRVALAYTLSRGVPKNRIIVSTITNVNEAIVSLRNNTDIARYNVAILDIVSDFGIVLFDANSIIGTDYALLSAADGLHVNDKGNRKLTQNLIELIKTIV